MVRKGCDNIAVLDAKKITLFGLLIRQTLRSTSPLRRYLDQSVNDWVTHKVFCNCLP